MDTATCAKGNDVPEQHPKPQDHTSTDVQEQWTASLGSVYPHSQKDTDTHGAESGFNIHSAQHNKCDVIHYTSSSSPSPPPCNNHLSEMNGHPCPAWASRNVPLQGECSPPGPLHLETTQTPMSISAGTESINNGLVGLDLYESEIGTVDNFGIPAPGVITSGDA